MKKLCFTQLFFLLMVVLLSSSTTFGATLYYCDTNTDFYSLDPVTFADTFLFSAASISIYGLAGSSVSDTIYGADQGSQSLISINIVTNSTTTVGSFTADLREIGFDRNTGTLYGSDYSNLYTINTATGAATLVGSHGGITTVWALGYDLSTNTLFGVDYTTASLYSINTSTGAATLIGATGLSRLGDIYVDPETYVLYGVGQSTEQFLYSINKATGVATQLSTTALIGWPMGLGAPPGPLAIDLLSFEAEVERPGVALTWETGSETDCLGFNLVRLPYQDGIYGLGIQINDELIPAEGSAYSGATYFYYDYTVTPNNTYRYLLKEVTTDSLSQTAGVVDVSTNQIYEIKILQQNLE